MKKKYCTRNKNNVEVGQSNRLLWVKRRGRAGRRAAGMDAARPAEPPKSTQPFPGGGREENFFPSPPHPSHCCAGPHPLHDDARWHACRAACNAPRRPFLSHPAVCCGPTDVKSKSMAEGTCPCGRSVAVHTTELALGDRGTQTSVLPACQP